METTTEGRALVDALREHGFTFAAGVPCGALRGAIAHLEDGGLPWLAAVREDTAVGAAIGAVLGGARSVVFMSMAGLGRSLTALWSLSRAYEMPLLLVVATDRDAHQALPPEHDLGQTTGPLLELLGATSVVLERGAAAAQVGAAASTMSATGRPVVLLAREGVLA